MTVFRPPSAALRQCVGLAARIASASIGGYALAVATAFAVARGLPISRVEAMTTASLLAILAMPAAAIWSFAAPGPRSATAGVFGLTTLFALAAWLLGQPA